MAVIRTSRIAAGIVGPVPLDLRERSPEIVAPYASGGVVFTAPSGSRTILRHLDLYVQPFAEPGGTNMYCSGTLILGGTQNIEDWICFYYRNFAPVDVQIWGAWDGQLVMEPGDQLYVGSTQNFTQYQASGAIVPFQ